jgi:hypothetical protein
MTQFIDELLSGSVSSDGYGQLLRLIKKQIVHRRWPPSILAETASEDTWSEDRYSAFAHQFLIHIIEKNKLVLLKHLPAEARHAYFLMFLAQYVADRIKHHQRQSGLSFAQLRRSAVNVLQKDNKIFLRHQSGSRTYWYRSNSQTDIVITEAELGELIAQLPSPHIMPGETRIHLHVKERLKDILEIAGCLVEEDLLARMLYRNLCPQTITYSASFETIPDDSQPPVPVQDNHQKTIIQILASLDEADRLILKDYFLAAPEMSLKERALRLSMPKSTLHHRLTAIKTIIFQTFTPISEQDGLIFLEKLQSALDDFH